MRLHTNNLTESDIRDALIHEQKAGRIDWSVDFETLEERGSRSHARAFEVQLGWYGNKVVGDGRRFKNRGDAGADNVYAAFYGEWGWFINRLFWRDASMTFGQYKSHAGFHTATNEDYRTNA